MTLLAHTNFKNSPERGFLNLVYHDRMSGLDLNAQITLLKHTVGSTCQDLYTQYSQIRGAQTGAISNNSILTSKKVELKHLLDSLRTEADTLDQEYLDRNTIKPGSAERYGILTKQDWILLFFFLSYGLMCLATIIFILQKSTTKIKATGIFIGLASAVGVVLAMTITSIG
jgi:hypothetical protein